MDISQTNLREYIDSLKVEGYTVRDDHGDDPVLISPDGRAVETWKQDCPYPSLMSRNDYEVEKYLLQIELLKFQCWTTDTGADQAHQHRGRAVVLPALRQPPAHLGGDRAVRPVLVQPRGSSG